MSRKRKLTASSNSFVCDICGPEASFQTQQALLVHKKSAGHKTRHKLAIKHLTTAQSTIRPASWSDSQADGQGSNLLDQPQIEASVHKSTAEPDYQASSPPTDFPEPFPAPARPAPIQPNSFGFVQRPQEYPTFEGSPSRPAQPDKSFTDLQLTSFEKVALPGLVKLSGKELSKACRGFFEEVGPESFRWQNKQQLELDFLAHEEWEQVDISPELLAFSVQLLQRKDRLHALQELVLQAESPNFEYKPLYIGHEQLYTSAISSGTWFRAKQAAVACAIPGAEGILPYILYSDASVVRLGGHTFHPVVAFSAAGSLRETRAANGYRHIGFLPVITPKSVGYSSKPTGSALFGFRRLKRLIFDRALRQLLEPFKRISFRAINYKIRSGNDIVWRRLVALPAMYLADLPELAHVGNLSESKFPIGAYLVPADELDNTNGLFPRRTEKNMCEVVASAQQLQQQGEPNAAEALLDSCGLQYAREAALAGFHFTSFPDLLTADRLHLDTGIWSHVLELIRGQLSNKAVAAVDASLACAPRFSLLRRHSGGLSSPSNLASAEHLMGLGKLLLVSLLADQGAHAYIGLVKALLDWQELRDADEHTPASLQDLAVARLRFQKLAMEEHSAFKSWCFRKFFLMRLFEETIAFFGSSNWTSTAYGESTHHSFKSHASFTNNRSRLVDAQILKHFRLEVAVRAALDANHIRAKSSKSLANKAAQSGKIVVGTSKQRCSPQSLCTAERPDLSDFLAALAAFLHLSDDSGIQVDVTDSLAIPMPKHRGSGDEGLVLRATKVFGEDKAERFDIIIVRGEEDEQLWYGQLRLIFSVRRPSDWKMQHYVYVRWLKETPVHTEARVAVGLPCVGWETRRRGGVLVPRQDVVEIDSICGPAYLQEDPSARGLFFVNRYIV